MGNKGRLFWLDLITCAATGALLIVLLFAVRRIPPHRFAQRGPSFWAGTDILLVFALVGVLGALDFDRAFTAFHSIFFPGKTNWLFDPRTDQIILILPDTYFRNCAILALALLAAWALFCLLLGRKRKPVKT